MFARTIAATALALGAVSFMTPASADWMPAMNFHLGHAPTENSQAVNVADIDISQPSGAKEFLKRVTLASEQVCGPRPTPFDQTINPAAYKSCVTKSVSKTVSQVNQPVVTALYKGETVVFPGEGATASVGSQK